MDPVADDRCPWRKFDYLKEYMWWASSNHLNMLKFSKYEVPRSFVLIQECNMAGPYIRIIAYDIENKTYFQVSAPNDKSWPFSLQLSEMKAEDTVAYKDGTHYKVLDRFQNNEYIKVLEWIMEPN